ncbi:DNA-binding transcriptional regulator YhcF (GntR family) [Saccharothrix tamanrassetensis]|uniref:DNA-binding transcriptional regulator YhcF (GntR family) n=1 Tax=Saccharothrix tamanrassetensis TaxID=1051531 RepID=A0A841CAI1_9PSEU|nr:GntR family transcriptional regulator [Saccharothrix tamanrassetensis]MBB5954409.1 DNA-binding transcriptional regulator YhcF (GntR family) [Saccharothrix tamanrassetensis]
MTRVVVDPDSGVAPWRQVRDQLVHLIRVGQLPVGSPLPSIRQLARDLGLSAGTVARVYRELETAGLLHTARRRGTVVAAIPANHANPSPGDRANPSAATDIASALAAAAARYAAEIRTLGIDPDTAVRAVRDACTPG